MQCILLQLQELITDINVPRQHTYTYRSHDTVQLYTLLIFISFTVNLKGFMASPLLFIHSAFMFEPGNQKSLKGHGMLSQCFKLAFYKKKYFSIYYRKCLKSQTYIISVII